MLNAKDHTPENRSEVAQLLQQIQEEYEAGRRGLSGLTYGNARHEFITQRMANMGMIYDELHSLVGDTAMTLIVDTFNACSDEKR